VHRGTQSNFHQWKIVPFEQVEIESEIGAASLASSPSVYIGVYLRKFTDNPAMLVQRG